MATTATLNPTSTSSFKRLDQAESRDTINWVERLKGHMALDSSEQNARVVHATKYESDTAARQIVSSLLQRPKTSSIFDTQEVELQLPEETIKANAQLAMQKALEEAFGPCRIERSDKPAEHLPANAVEVHTEHLSPTQIRLTARCGDEGQSMLSIIFDLIRLGIKHEETDRLYRDQLQGYMIVHMEKVTENLLSQSKMIFTASIAAGVLGIAGGLLPIVGILKGNAILKKMSKLDWFSSLKDAKQEKVFGSLSRSLDAASRTTEMANRAQTTQADGLKYQEEGKSKVFEIKQSEATQSLRDRAQRKDSYFSMLDRVIERWYQFFQSLCR